MRREGLEASLQRQQVSAFQKCANMNGLDWRSSNFTSRIAGVVRADARFPIFLPSHWKPPVQNGTVSLSVKMHVPWLTPHEVVERVLLAPHEVVERVPLSAAHHVVEPGRAAPAPQGEELAPGMTVVSRVCFDGQLEPTQPSYELVFIHAVNFSNPTRGRYSLKKLQEKPPELFRSFVARNIRRFFSSV